MIITISWLSLSYSLLCIMYHVSCIFTGDLFLKIDFTWMTFSGSTHLDGIPDESLVFIDEHWRSFPPQVFYFIQMKFLLTFSFSILSPITLLEFALDFFGSSTLLATDVSSTSFWRYRMVVFLLKWGFQVESMFALYIYILYKMVS